MSVTYELPQLDTPLLTVAILAQGAGDPPRSLNLARSLFVPWQAFYFARSGLEDLSDFVPWHVVYHARSGLEDLSRPSRS